MLTDFVRLTHAEFLKTKRIPLFAFYLVISFGSIGFLFMNFYLKPYEVFLREHNYFEHNPNPWFHFFSNYFYLLAIVLPIIASITTYIIKSIEDKADAWKRLLVLPYDKSIIHFSKLFLIYLYLTFFLFSIYFLLEISSLALSQLKPDFHFFDFNTYHKTLIIFFLKFELAAISIATISYGYMIVIKRAMISLLLSIFLPFLGLTFTSNYNSLLSQWWSFRAKRSFMIMNNIAGYDAIRVDLISSYDILSAFILGVSIIFISWASAKPVINFE